jgi:hypothetical protein
MASTERSRALVLVKALPQPSKRYGETVCCAGITETREWKRLFPVRFRHLQGASGFSRWQWISFEYRRPTADPRKESCHVFEESIKVDATMPSAERARFLPPILRRSAKEAASSGDSLALIRPRNTRFLAKPKTRVEIDEERDAFRRAARQTSMFDKELAELDPSPYEFRFQFEDEAGKHDYENGDWEAHAMFWRESKRTSAAEALKWMSALFNEEYPKRGMVFAIGNQAKRPQTWQLLGVIRLDEVVQRELF